MEHNKKEIVVTRESQLRDIREAFSRFYPFLIMELSYNSHLCAGRSEVRISSEDNTKVAADIPTPFTIDVSGQRTVSEVMHDVTNLCRVKVQICRKSGNVLNAVSLTVNWTLERQNTAGEYISSIMG